MAMLYQISYRLDSIRIRRSSDFILLAIIAQPRDEFSEGDFVKAVAEEI